MAFLLAKPRPLDVNHDNDRFSMFNKKLDIPAGGIAPRSVELCEASAAVNDVKRPSRFVQQRGCLFPFHSEKQARLVRPEVA
jgi:hypothetical protein